jgi:hypothetical protein
MDNQCGARSATKEAANGAGQLNCARQDVVAFVRQRKAATAPQLIAEHEDF